MEVVRESWTADRAIQIAQGFNAISELRKNYSKAYAAARRLNVLDRATSHIIRKNPIGRWASLEAVVEDARKYQSKTEWYGNSARACASAKKNRWFDGATEHML